MKNMNNYEVVCLTHNELCETNGGVIPALLLGIIVGLIIVEAFSKESVLD